MNWFRNVLVAMVASMAICTSAALLPLGTFFYAGTVRNHSGALLSAASHAMVQAVDAKGNIIAEAPVVDPSPEGLNYRLAIPVTSASTAKTAATGDTLRCVVVESGVPYAAPLALPPVGDANTHVICNLQLFSDTDADGVSDEYVSALAPWLDANGIDEYDPAADYDSDGASNYEEYCAGTNPFDPNDVLAITAIAPVPDKAGGAPLAAVSFEYAGGRLYTIQSTTNLAAPDAWADTAHYRTPSSTAAQAQSLATPLDDIGIATLYLAPAADARFFRIDATPE